MFRSAIIPQNGGRYRPSGREQLVAEAVDAVADDEDWSPSYNIDSGHRLGLRGDRYVEGMNSL